MCRRNCVPEARSGVRSFDQPRNVGDHETLFFSLVTRQDNAKVRLERGKRIIRHLRPRRRDARDQRRFAHIRISHEADIGQQFQLQAEVALFARASFFVLARGLVGGSGKLRVAASAASAARNHDALVGTRKIVNFLACVLVENDCAHGHLQDNPFAVAARFLVALAVPSALRLVFRIETEMHQRIVALARFHPDVAALAAIAARRPAPRNKLLPPERHAAVATIPSLNSNFGFIDKHRVQPTYDCVARAPSPAKTRLAARLT